MKKKNLAFLGIVMLLVIFLPSILVIENAINSSNDYVSILRPTYSSDYEEDSSFDSLNYGMNFYFAEGFGLNVSTGQYTGLNVGKSYITCSVQIDDDYEFYDFSPMYGISYTNNYIHSMRITLQMYVNNVEYYADSVGLEYYTSDKLQKDSSESPDFSVEESMVDFFDKTDGNSTYIHFDQKYAGNPYQNLSIFFITAPLLGVIFPGDQVKYEITTQVWIKEYTYECGPSGYLPLISVLGGGFTKSYTDSIVLTKI